MTRTVALLLALGACMTWGALAQEPDTSAIDATAPAGPAVEVAFVLDTTGSMSDLIQAAKEKIWAIANTLATAKPAPDIKMALVGYRDRGDEYVTKITDLTNDLDAVYNDLMGYAAHGGSDTPESVNQALHEAVTKLSWGDGKEAYRVIFLVGDAPPHMDYENDVKYPDSCKKAIGNGIYINTIQCGSINGTDRIWRDIAAKAEGRYFRVEQSGNAILAETPFDEELGRLSTELEGTRVFYGTAEVQAEMAAKGALGTTFADVAPASAKAQRAFFNISEAGAANFLGKQELVDAYSNEAVDLEKMPTEELPEELRDMTIDERKEYLGKKAERRSELSEQIRELGEKRQAYLEEQVRKLNLEDKGTLDHSVFECIQTQAEKKGIRYEGGPAL